VGKKGLVSFESKMHKLIIDHMHVPLDSIVRSSQWLNSEFRFIRSGSREFQVVCDAITAEWVHYTLDDLVMFGKERNLSFGKMKSG